MAGYKNDFLCTLQIIKDQHCLKMPSLVRAKAENIQYIQYTLLGHHKNESSFPSQACAIAIVFHFFPRKKKVVKEDSV